MNKECTHEYNRLLELAYDVFRINSEVGDNNIVHEPEYRTFVNYIHSKQNDSCIKILKSKYTDIHDLFDQNNLPQLKRRTILNFVYGRYNDYPYTFDFGKRRKKNFNLKVINNEIKYLKR